MIAARETKPITGKVAGAFLFILLSVLIFLCLPNTTRAANQTGIVTASLLNVRTGAGKSHDILQHAAGKRD